MLPPAQVEVLYCELSAAEKDFYEALFKRSKVELSFLFLCFKCFLVKSL